MERSRARTGTEALERLLQHEVALALVDVQLPGMDGVELAEFMRGAARTREIPIIFVTAGLHDQTRVFRGYEAARFDPVLRAHIVFTDHSLATDQVFAEVQLVTCRNVLIYFDGELQDRAIGLFRDALGHKGFLGLGMGETLRHGAHADAFEAANGALRLYRKL